MIRIHGLYFILSLNPGDVNTSHKTSKLPDIVLFEVLVGTEAAEDASSEITGIAGSDNLLSLIGV